MGIVFRHRHILGIPAVDIPSCCTELLAEVLLSVHTKSALSTGRINPPHPYPLPTLKRRARSPIPMISPTTWWPGTTGRCGGGVRPSISSSSVWQTPQVFTLISISPLPGNGSGSSHGLERFIGLRKVAYSLEDKSLHLFLLTRHRDTSS